MSNFISQFTGLQIEDRLTKAGTAVQPEGLTKTAVGLSNVDNTSDASKPISTATQAALDAKQVTLVSGINIKTINGASLLGEGDMVISGGGTSALQIDNKTSAYTVVASDLGKIINCTAGIFTVSLTAAATLGAGFNCWIWNTSATATDAITLVPNASEKIDGVSTLKLRRGEGLQIVCDGTNWQTGDKKVMRAYAENIAQSNTRPIASGVNAIAIGYNSTASGVESSAFGIGTIASAPNSLAIGNGTTASATSSTAFGGNSGGTASQAISGAGAMALGGSYASGTDSFAAAVANNTSSYGATVSNSVAIGQNAKVSGVQSVAIGFLASASAGQSVAIGGIATASERYSLAIGYASKADRAGKQAYASGTFASAGDAQSGKMVLRRQTTDATTTVLVSDGSTPGSTNQVILPNDSTFAFTVLVVARRTDADNESAGYKFEGVIDRNADAVSTAFVGTVSKTVLAADSVAWDCNVSADTTNGGLKIEVTGETGKTIRWVATAWTTEVTG